MPAKSSSSFFAPVALVCLTTLAAACTSGTSTPASPPASVSTTTPKVTARGNVNGTLAFGQLAPQTGTLAAISKSLTAPVQIAVNEINAAGGVNGKPVTLAAVADDGSGANTALARTNLTSLLKTNRVDAVMGPAASGTALDLLNAIKTNRALMCSGSNSAAELSTADSGGYYFRTAPPDRLQALALAQLALNQGRKQPVVVARDDAYGQAFTAPLLKKLIGGGALPLGKLITYDPEATDLSSVARQVAARHPDSVIAISLVDDGARLVKALAAAGVGPNKIPTYVPDGMQSTTFQQKVDPANPSAAAGIRGTAPAASPAGLTDPLATELRKAGADPVFSAHYYDCTILTALAALQAGTDDPTKLAAAFPKSLRGANDCATFAECAAWLTAKKTIHYRGASSRFDHWNGHEPGDGVYDVWSYDATGQVVTAPSDQQLRVP